MNPVIANPRPANAAAPRASASASEKACAGQGVDFNSRPRRKSATVCNVKTSMIDASTATRYVGDGRGVARIRFRIPISRFATSRRASPAKAVFAAP